MNLYMVTRWGNPFEEDGPDGKDTNFLIRATSIEEASFLADQRLKTMVSEITGNRPVKNFSQFALEIGIDSFSEKKGIVHGPWIESIITHDTGNYPTWHRDNLEGNWKRS